MASSSAPTPATFEEWCKRPSRNAAPLDPLPVRFAFAAAPEHRRGYPEFDPEEPRDEGGRWTGGGGGGGSSSGAHAGEGAASTTQWEGHDVHMHGKRPKRETMEFIEEHNRKTEEAGVLYETRTGEEIFRAVGEKNAIHITKEKIDEMRRHPSATFIHGHSDSMHSVTDADFRASSTFGISRTIAVARDGTVFWAKTKGIFDDYKVLLANFAMEHVAVALRHRGLRGEDGDTATYHVRNQVLVDLGLLAGYAVLRAGPEFKSLTTKYGDKMAKARSDVTDFARSEGLEPVKPVIAFEP